MSAEPVNVSVESSDDGTRSIYVKLGGGVALEGGTMANSTLRKAWTH